MLINPPNISSASSPFIRQRPRAKSEPAIYFAQPAIVYAHEQSPVAPSPTAPEFVLRPSALKETRAIIREARHAVRNGQLDAANAVLDAGVAENLGALPTWNEKLFLNRNRLGVVYATVAAMRAVGVGPNNVATFRALSWASELANDSMLGWEIFQGMERESAPIDRKTAGHLINVFTNNYQPHYVWALLSTVHRTGVASEGVYHEAIKSLVSLRVPEHAHQGMMMMGRAGYTPDVTLFNGTLDLYRIVAKPEQVWSLFNAMSAFRVEPDAWTAAVVRRSFAEWDQRLRRDSLRMYVMNDNTMQ